MTITRTYLPPAHDDCAVRKDGNSCRKYARLACEHPSRTRQFMLVVVVVEEELYIIRISK